MVIWLEQQQIRLVHDEILIGISVCLSFTNNKLVNWFIVQTVICTPRYIIIIDNIHLVRSVTEIHRQI